MRSYQHCPRVIAISRIEYVKAFAQKHLSGTPYANSHYFGNVRKSIELIGRDLDYNKEIIESAVFLYKCGAQQWLKFRQDFPQTSLALSQTILEKSQFNAKEIEAIMHCIREHGIKGKPSSIEAKILHDADLLENIGFSGIAWNIYINGLQGADFINSFGNLKSNLSEIDEESFVLRSSRGIAGQKLKNSKNFLQEIEKEQPK